MSGGESSEEEKEYAKEGDRKREREQQRKTRKRSETKTGLNVGGIIRGLELDAGEVKGGGGGRLRGEGERGTRGSGYRSIPGLIRTIFRSREREAIFFPGSVDEKRLRTRCHAEMMGK